MAIIRRSGQLERLEAAAPAGVPRRLSIRHPPAFADSHLDAPPSNISRVEFSMDLNEILAELHEALVAIDDAIHSFERIAAGQPTRRGRPRKWS